MKTIKVLISASEEMHNEKVKFQSLINELNPILATHGFELERIKWNPEEDGTIKDFQSKLGQCEVCLTLYWNKLAGNSEEEFDRAYQELKNGNNPHHIYVFFKEPAKDLTDALQVFKNGIELKYGHFFCKFENVDTMNLQFTLKFLASHKELEDEQNPLITVGGGKVKVGEKVLANLDQVPFAALNKEYRRLQKNLEELETQVIELKTKHVTNPENKEIEDAYFKIRSQREKLLEEFNKYQSHLFEIALNFARLEGERYSERMRKAKEEFENGNAIVADEILDLEEMKREAKHEIQQMEQHRGNLEIKIEEFCLKAETVIANTELPISERFRRACEAYEEALSLANNINCDEAKKADIHFDYAYLLQQFNKFSDALTHFSEAKVIRQHLSDNNPRLYMSDYAEALNGVANIQSVLHQKGAESNYEEALDIRRALAEENQNISSQLDLVATLNNLANYQCDAGDCIHAEQNYREALDICRQIEKGHSKSYENLLAGALNNFAGFLFRIGDVNSVLEAEDKCNESLELYQHLAKENPEKYEPDYAMALGLLAVILLFFQRFPEAENEFREALAIYKRLAKENPEKYEPKVALTLRNIAVMQMQRDIGPDIMNAQKNITEALDIYERWAIYYPKMYKHEIAGTLNNLAMLQKDLEQHLDAEKNYVKAIDIYRQYATSEPRTYEIELAETHVNLSGLFFHLGRLSKAQDNLNDALAIYERLEEKNPGLYTEKIEDLKGSFWNINNLL